MTKWRRGWRFVAVVYLYHLNRFIFHLRSRTSSLVFYESFFSITSYGYNLDLLHMKFLGNVAAIFIIEKRECNI